MMDGSDIVAAELARRAKGQEAVRAAEAQAAEEAMAQGNPPLVYHVVRPLEHNGERYEIGSTFRSPDEAAVRALREADCLRLATELEPAEDVAAKLARLELQAAEAEDLRARVAELEAAAAAAEKAAEKQASGKGAKAEKAAEKPAEA